MTRRVEDLQMLGLSSEDVKAQDSQRSIRKAFLRLSKTHHPDKGGTNEGFQKLTEAYYRLREEEAQGGQSDEQEQNASAQRAEERSDHDSGTSWQEYDYYNFWQHEFFHFFRQNSYHDYGHSDEDNSYQEYGYSDEEDGFRSWEQEAYDRKKSWSEIHKQQLKVGVDFRDANAINEADACVFCGQNKPIEKRKAKNHGVKWIEYTESTKPRPGKEEGYNTCWICKTNHISVMTEKMGKTKFAKKLEDSSIFQQLRRVRCTFTAQPKTAFCKGPRTSEYFWYPDLETAALAAGWKPRGKQKERVPWEPQNNKMRKVPPTPTTLAVAVTPGSSTKKTKRRRSEDDDKKPSAKRGLKF